MINRISWFIIFYFYTLLLSNVVSCTEKSEADPNLQREVVATINPGCPKDSCSNFTLVHVQLKGNYDTLHHIWTMENKPIMFYARTDLTTNLQIDWNLMLNNERNQSISFSTKPYYFAAVMISKFFVFDDPFDTVAIPDNSSQVFTYNTLEMLWQLNYTDFSSNSSATAVFKLESYQGSQLNSVEIILTASGNRERSSVLPHLMFTENSTQLDMVFDDIEIRDMFPNARLGAELIVIAQEPNHPFSISDTHSLDDEYTPGVFELIVVQSPLQQHFLQWRPVCYTSTERDISDSTSVLYSNIKDVNISLLEDNFLNWMFTEDVLQATLVQGFNISFGMAGDGFYKASNFTAWTFMSGYGRPIQDQFSLMVKLVMAIGLGLPFSVLLIGGTAIACKNYRNRKDDLLLSN